MVLDLTFLTHIGVVTLRTRIRSFVWILRAVHIFVLDFLIVPLPCWGHSWVRMYSSSNVMVLVSLTFLVKRLHFMERIYVSFSLCRNKFRTRQQ